jgi:hypothetical protein
VFYVVMVVVLRSSSLGGKGEMSSSYRMIRVRNRNRVCYPTYLPDLPTCLALPRYCIFHVGEFVRYGWWVQVV